MAVAEKVRTSKSGVLVGSGKVCKVCLVLQPDYLYEVYNNGVGCGVRGTCKPCRIRMSAEWKQQNPERTKAANRASQKRRQGFHSAQTRAYRCAHPDIAVAHWTVGNAIRYGKIQKPKRCQQCNRSVVRIEGHHTDYSKPLEVQWLCKRCHANRHR